MGCDQIRSTGKSSQILLAAPLRRFQLSLSPPKQIELNETLLWSPKKVWPINNHEKDSSTCSFRSGHQMWQLKSLPLPSLIIILLCHYHPSLTIFPSTQVYSSSFILSSPHAIFSNSVDHATRIVFITPHQSTIHTKLTSGSIYFPSQIHTQYKIVTVNKIWNIYQICLHIGSLQYCVHCEGQNLTEFQPSTGLNHVVESWIAM